MLRSAKGEPVSYAVLQEAGIEFPASVACELELAGTSIEHCHVGAEHGQARRGRVPALRLDPRADPEPEPASGLDSDLRRSAMVEPERHIYVARPTPLFTPSLRGAFATSAGAGRAAGAGTAGGRAASGGAARERLGRGGHDARGGVQRGRATADGAQRRWLAPALLLAGAAVVAAILIAALGGGGEPAASVGAGRGADTHDGAHARHALARRAAGGGTRHAAARSGSTGRASSGAVRPQASGGTEAPGSAAASSASGQAASGAATAPKSAQGSLPEARPQSSSAPGESAVTVSAARAAELEAQGHSLLSAGRFSDATPVLRDALAATGERVSNCVAPESEACLTYAYALYDLGRSLQLGGDPAAAVPILESRLEIDNQRPVVQAALEAARASSRP